jgi:FkbM family methyltransferase
MTIFQWLYRCCVLVILSKYLSGSAFETMQESSSQHTDADSKTTTHGAMLLGSNLGRVVGKYGFFVFPLTDTMVGQSLHVYGEWSEHELSIFSFFVQPGDLVFDIGANIGAFTIPFGKLVGSTGRVVAVEAQPALFDILTENIVLNALDTIISPMNAVVGTAGGTIVNVPIVNYSKPANFGSLSISKEGSSEMENRGISESSVEVQSMSLDEIYNLYGYCPTFIKIDVEGMELPVLQGAEQTIRECDVVLYVENNCRKKSEALLRLLIEVYRYKVFWSVHPYYNSENFRGYKTDIFTDALISMNVLAIPEALEETLDIVNFVQINEKAGFKLEDYMITWKNSSAIIKQHEDCD